MPFDAAVVLVETEARMPRTYPCEAEACLGLSGKALKDVKFRSLVQKMGKTDDLARTHQSERKYRGPGTKP